MSNASPPPRQETHPSRQAFVELAAKRYAFAIQAAKMQAELRAMDASLKALEQNAREEMVHLILTKGDAGLLMGICWQYTALIPQLNGNSKEYIDRLGGYVFDAIYQQNADFAERVRRLCGTSAAEPATQAPPTDKPRKQIPKKYRPYLKYDADAIEIAWEKSMLENSRHYVTCDHARLYLTRTALVEMYKQPGHLKYIYAGILKALDDAASFPGASSIRRSTVGEVYEDPLPASSATRWFRPYTQYAEDEMKAARRHLGIQKADIRLTGGYLAINLSRAAIFQFYKRVPQVRPAIAWLMRHLDESSGTGRAP